MKENRQPEVEDLYGQTADIKIDYMAETDVPDLIRTTSPIIEETLTSPSIDQVETQLKEKIALAERDAKRSKELQRNIQARDQDIFRLQEQVAKEKAATRELRH